MLVDRMKYYLKKFDNQNKKETQEKILATKQKSKIMILLEEYYNKCLEGLKPEEFGEFVEDNKAMMPMPASVCKQFLQGQFGEVLEQKNINLLYDIPIFDYPF